MIRARRRRPEERQNHDRWLVSYADFITLLFAFFTTLYAISNVDQQKAGKLLMSMMQALHVNFFPAQEAGQGPAAAITPGAPALLAPVEVAHRPDDPRQVADRSAQLTQLAREMEQFVATAELRGKVLVRVERRGVVLSLAEAGFFESGSAELAAGGRSALEVLARRLADRPELAVMVEGHTDNVRIKGGPYASNWELSTARATFVVAFFIERGLDPRRLSAAGYSEHRPVSGNETAEGRAKNRRVDIVLQDQPILESPATVAPDPAAGAKPAPASSAEHPPRPAVSPKE